MNKKILLVFALLIGSTAYALNNVSVIPSNILFGKASSSTDKSLFANQNSATNPLLKYNHTTSKWQVSNDGTNFFDISPGAGALYNEIVGTATQVSNGLAGYSTVGAAITAATAGDRILILQNTYSENVTVAKKLYFEGTGEAAVVSGTWTWASGSNYSGLSGIKVTGNMTFNSTVDGVQVEKVWFSTGSTFVDNTTTTYNIYQGFIE